MPTSPTYSTAPSAGSGSGAASLPAVALTQPPLVPTPTFAGGGGGLYPTYPTYGYTTTTPGVTVSPTPTPTHASLCTGAPTGAQILAFIKGKSGIPDKSLKVASGPYCAEDWAFTTVEVTGENADEQDPLMVVTYGTDSLQLVAAGSDVCNDPVQTGAPAGVRVLACGF